MSQHLSKSKSSEMSGLETNKQYKVPIPGIIMLRIRDMIAFFFSWSSVVFERNQFDGGTHILVSNHNILICIRKKHTDRFIFFHQSTTKSMKKLESGDIMDKNLGLISEISYDLDTTKEQAHSGKDIQSMTFNLYTRFSLVKDRLHRYPNEYTKCKKSILTFSSS